MGDRDRIAAETGRKVTEADFRKGRAMNRRKFMTIAAAAMAMPGPSKAQLAAQHPVRLVLVHGRSQQGFNPAELQSVWLETLRRGAAKLNRSLPERLEVAFPFYGVTLDEFAKQRELPLTTDIQAKGAAADNDFLTFQAAVAEACRRHRRPGRCRVRAQSDAKGTAELGLGAGHHPRHRQVRRRDEPVGDRGIHARRLSLHHAAWRADPDRPHCIRRL